MHINTYEQANEYLGSKADRPLTGKATRVQRRGDSIVIRYQATDVVTYRPDGTIVLNSGGWRTPTTKGRIVEYTAARVHSERGVWYIGDPAVRFTDGMTIDGRGAPVGPATAVDPKCAARLDRAVSKYIKGYAEAMAHGTIEGPEAGDCFGCLFQAADGPPAAPHGRVEPMGIDHYLGHLGIEPWAEGEGPYFVPSLLWNAINARHGDPQFIASLIWSQSDGRMAADVLRSYFRKLKPALLALMEARKV